MKRWVAGVLASAFLGACATSNSDEDARADAMRNAPKEDFVTGSRFRRSESMENYQGTRGTTREDYQNYKNPTSLPGGS